MQELMRPLREIRQARQKPAHALRTNFTDGTFVHRQVALLDELAATLGAMVRWLSTHANNREWKPSFEPETYYRIDQMSPSRPISPTRRAGPVPRPDRAAVCAEVSVAS
jgi:hypothetical protein